MRSPSGNGAPHGRGSTIIRALILVSRESKSVCTVAILFDVRLYFPLPNWAGLMRRADIGRYRAGTEVAHDAGAKGRVAGCLEVWGNCMDLSAHPEAVAGGVCGVLAVLCACSGELWWLCVKIVGK